MIYTPRRIGRRVRYTWYQILAAAAPLGVVLGVVLAFNIGG